MTEELKAFEAAFPPPPYMVYDPAIDCYRIADGHFYCEVYGRNMTQQDGRWRGWQARGAQPVESTAHYQERCRLQGEINRLTDELDSAKGAQQEPIAWTFHVREKRDGKVFSREFVSFDFVPNESEEIISKTPLYEATPPAQPDSVPRELTPEMIDAAERIDWSDEDVRGSIVKMWNVMRAAQAKV